ncbi:hypothetical protein [Amycolatopsis alba]|uniref:hypothetical protein n=1 Tax=Amycolatopsis alba TaxID=76020 RepID=UPI0012FAB614|nr:hypothetical protein [Amycolatopsis alba]
MGNERPRYWFPLALLGFAQLAVVASSVGTGRYEGRAGYAPYGTGGLYGVGPGVEMSRESNTAIAVAFGDVGRMDAWFFAVFVIYAGTALYYTLRMRREGRVVPWWVVLVTVVGGLAIIALADLSGLAKLDMPGDVRTAVLLTVGLALLAWLESSVLVLVVTAAYVLCAVVLAQGQLALLLSSLVALAGAFAALLSRPKAAAEEA